MLEWPLPLVVQLPRHLPVEAALAGRTLVAAKRRGKQVGVAGNVLAGDAEESRDPDPHHTFVLHAAADVVGL